jgi:antitoxin ParD1/3/4
MTTTMNISLPDTLKAFIDERVKACGYGSHSEYLRDLVRKDETEAAKDKLRGLILEGLSSASGRSWEAIRLDLLKRTEVSSEE